MKDTRKHKCRIRKGKDCATYCSDVRALEITHLDKWRDVDCEECKAEGLRLGHFQPKNKFPESQEEA